MYKYVSSKGLKIINYCELLRDTNIRVEKSDAITILFSKRTIFKDK